MRPEQNGRYFADAISNSVFENKMYVFRFKFHWSLFPGLIDNKSAWVLVIVSGQADNKPLAEPIITKIYESTINVVNVIWNAVNWQRDHTPDVMMNN